MLERKNIVKVLPIVLLTVFLCAVFSGMARIDSLEKHAYTMDFGWELSDANLMAQHGICDRDLKAEGFPLQSKRPAISQDDMSGCLDETNTLAQVFDVTLALGLSALTATAVRLGAKSRRS